MNQLPAIIPDRSPKRLPSEYRVTARHTDGFTFARQGASTRVLLDGETMKWATAEYVTEAFLAKMARLRNLERRAPRGDGHASWQKVAEVPLNWFKAMVPEMEDEKRVAKVLNDSDYRRLRCDGNHRRL